MLGLISMIFLNYGYGYGGAQWNAKKIRNFVTLKKNVIASKF